MPNRIAISGGQPFNRHALSRWLQSKRGKRLLALEERELRRVLPDLFGRHILQIGNWGARQQLLTASDMLHRAVLGTLGDPDTQAVIQPESLPILDNSVDAVLLPHTLEFSPSPHILLREVDRILTDRGRLLILGFNPWSVWGLRHRLGLGFNVFPSGARFYRTGRLGDWLELLDFEVTEQRCYGVGFPWAPARSVGGPLNLPGLLNPLMEGYLIVAKKRVIPMSLVGRLPRAQVRAFVGRPIGGVATRLTGVPSQGSDLDVPNE